MTSVVRKLILLINWCWHEWVKTSKIKNYTYTFSENKITLERKIWAAYVAKKKILSSIKQI